MADRQDRDASFAASISDRYLQELEARAQDPTLGQTVAHIPREASVVRTILAFLRGLAGCEAEKTHGGRFGKKGKPDIKGALRGHPFAFEVKRPGGEATPLQQTELARLREAGYIVGVVHSKAEVQALLWRILTEKERESLSPKGDGDESAHPA